MPITGAPGRSVTSKALAILEAFEALGSPLSLSQIAEATSLPLSTCHRLVGELCEWGAVDRDGNGRYHVGLRLWEVAQNGGRRLRETARPFLQDLFALTDATAHVAIREGNEALYIDRVYSSRRIPRTSRVGGRLPLHATAVGKVLLAHEEAWLQEAYVNRSLEAPTRWTHVNPQQLLEELGRIREQGYATTLEEVRAGSCSIAVPVLREEGLAEAAVGIVMLSTHATHMKRHLPALQGTAHRIEAAVSRYPRSVPAVAAHLRRTSTT